jgi:hypothetical protein
VPACLPAPTHRPSHPPAHPPTGPPPHPPTCGQLPGACGRRLSPRVVDCCVVNSMSSIPKMNRSADSVHCSPISCSGAAAGLKGQGRGAHSYLTNERRPPTPAKFQRQAASQPAAQSRSLAAAVAAAPGRITCIHQTESGRSVGTARQHSSQAQIRHKGSAVTRQQHIAANNIRGRMADMAVLLCWCILVACCWLAQQRGTQAQGPAVCPVYFWPPSRCTTQPAKPEQVLRLQQPSSGSSGGGDCTNSTLSPRLQVAVQHLQLSVQVVQRLRNVKRYLASPAPAVA